MSTPSDPRELQGWLRTGSHSWCPACGSARLYMRQVVLVSDKPVALAGVQLKYECQWGWEYLCFDCLDRGPCDLRPSTTQMLVEDAT